MSRRRTPLTPAPQRLGIRATRITFGPKVTAETVLDELLSMLPTSEDALLEAFAKGDIVDAHDHRLLPTHPATAGLEVFIHRPQQPEPVVPFEMPVLYEDEQIIAVDKPHFLATTPRGRHVSQTALVLLRNRYDYPELSPAHRLDRLTAGVLIFTKAQRDRQAFHGVFQDSNTTKTYEAVAGYQPHLTFPLELRLHVVKEHGTLQGFVADAAPPNSHTQIQLLNHAPERGYYRLTPSTGKTHQLRIHLSHLGIPIINDPLYPSLTPDPSLPMPGEVASFADPLQLLARTLSFTHPLTGERLTITSQRQLSTQSTAGHPGYEWPAVVEHSG